MEEKTETFTYGKICRKCLIREMMENGAVEESIQKMLKRIEMMDEDLRCSGERYEARLRSCKACENLLSGMCRICGCYVELRAAVKSNSCPAVKKRWEAENEEEKESF